MPIDMKTVISSTFVTMVKQKGIDKITVKALIDACGISRQTFYYHFQDIMEVIEWSMEQATKNMTDKSLKADTPQQAISFLVSSAVESRTLIHRLLDSQKRQQIEILFVQAIRTYLQELIRNKPDKISMDYADIEVALDFWAFGITGLLFKYCTKDSVDVESLANRICQLLCIKTENDRD
jgi:transcriptional regulator, tetR family